MDANLLLTINVRRIFEEAEERILREIKTELDTVGDVYSAETAQKWSGVLQEANAVSAAKDDKILHLTQTLEKHIQENQLLKIENDTLKKNQEQYMASMTKMHAEYTQRLAAYDAMVAQISQNNTMLTNMCVNAGLLNTNGQPNYMMNQYSTMYYPSAQAQAQVQVPAPEPVQERMPSFIQAQQQPAYSPIDLTQTRAVQESFKTFRENFIQKMKEAHAKNGSA